MEEEIDRFKFKTTSDVLTSYILETDTRYVIDVGAWYCTIAKNLLRSCPKLERYYAYEALTEITEYVRDHLSEDRLSITNTTLCAPERYRSYFNVVPSTTISTSGFWTLESSYTVRKQVGPIMTGADLFRRHREIISNSGLKLTTEGCNLHGLHVMFKLKLKPTFIYVQIPGSQTDHFLEKYWPHLAELYEVPLDTVTFLEERVTMLAIRRACVLWWSPVPTVPACKVSFGVPLEKLMKQAYRDVEVNEWYDPTK